eukprot:gene4148-14247_t
MSSSLYDSTDGDKAVDGNTNGLWSGRSIAHSRRESYPVLSVMFEATYRIDKVLVYNRQDCCADRLFPVTMELMINMVASYTKIVTSSIGSVLEFDLSEQSIMANMLELRLPGNDRTINVAEIEVYGILQTGYCPEKAGLTVYQDMEAEIQGNDYYATLFQEASVNILADFSAISGDTAKQEEWATALCADLLANITVAASTFSKGRVQQAGSTTAMSKRKLQQTDSIIALVVLVARNIDVIAETRVAVRELSDQTAAGAEFYHAGQCNLSQCGCGEAGVTSSAPLPSPSTHICAVASTGKTALQVGFSVSDPDALASNETLLKEFVDGLCSALLAGIPADPSLLECNIVSIEGEGISINVTAIFDQPLTKRKLVASGQGQGQGQGESGQGENPNRASGQGQEFPPTNAAVGTGLASIMQDEGAALAVLAAFADTVGAELLSVSGFPPPPPAPPTPSSKFVPSLHMMMAVTMVLLDVGSDGFKLVLATVLHVVELGSRRYKTYATWHAQMATKARQQEVQGMCYLACPDGDEGGLPLGVNCYESCPTAYPVRDGSACVTRRLSTSKECCVPEVCVAFAGVEQCIPAKGVYGCDGGSLDTGCACESTPSIYVRNFYKRTSSLPFCTSGRFDDSSGLCLADCSLGLVPVVGAPHYCESPCGGEFPTDCSLYCAHANVACRLDRFYQMIQSSAVIQFCSIKAEDSSGYDYYQYSYV